VAVQDHDDVRYLRLEELTMEATLEPDRPWVLMPACPSRSDCLGSLLYTHFPGGRRSTVVQFITLEMRR
jgi:hypothetical protein